MKVPGRKTSVIAAMVRMYVLSLLLYRLTAKEVSAVAMFKALSRCAIKVLHYKIISNELVTSFIGADGT
jgi:hypothetical protein